VVTGDANGVVHGVVHGWDLVPWARGRKLVP
jgi:hypothetical protein